ncbi:MAG: hypothetical protein ACLSHP_07225 [Coprococcus sp.]
MRIPQTVIREEELLETLRACVVTVCRKQWKEVTGQGGYAGSIGRKKF